VTSTSWVSRRAGLEGFFERLSELTAFDPDAFRRAARRGGDARGRSPAVPVEPTVGAAAVHYRASDDALETVRIDVADVGPKLDGFGVSSG
jgi:hypothetical protein